MQKVKFASSLQTLGWFKSCTIPNENASGKLGIIDSTDKGPLPQEKLQPCLSFLLWSEGVYYAVYPFFYFICIQCISMLKHIDKRNVKALSLVSSKLQMKFELQSMSSYMVPLHKTDLNPKILGNYESPLSSFCRSSLEM